MCAEFYKFSAKCATSIDFFVTLKSGMTQYFNFATIWKNVRLYLFNGKLKIISALTEKVFFCNWLNGSLIVPTIFGFIIGKASLGCPQAAWNIYVLSKFFHQGSRTSMLQIMLMCPTFTYIHLREISYCSLNVCVSM